MSELYVQGANVIDGVLSRSGSLKGLAMSHAKRSGIDPKRLLALTANTLAYIKSLEIALERAEILKLEKKVFPARKKALALVLAHDLLVTKRGRIATSPAWPPHAAMARHVARLKAELVKIQLEQGKASIQELRSDLEHARVVQRIPRWIRINQRRTSVESVIQCLVNEGWSEVKEGQFLTSKQKTFARSQHLSEVIATHTAHTHFWLQHRLFLQGLVILQDLASCFPAEVLLEQETGAAEKMHIYALDATSAPGNKTSHLSAKISLHGDDSSSILAMEHDAGRFETLKTQLGIAGCLDARKRPGAVTPLLGDFLNTDPAEYGDVTHMLLDPSCSGSGILGRLDHLTQEQDPSEPDDAAQDRLEALASFQFSMIEHAMKFPNLRRFTYSTCSIHHEENEDVVLRALNSDLTKAMGWQLAKASTIMPLWKTRGLAKYCGEDETIAQSMVRCVPGGSAERKEDDSGPDLEATNGFFLTCFVRSIIDPSAAVSGGATKKVSPEKRRKQRAKEKLRKKRAKNAKAKEASY